MAEVTDYYQVLGVGRDATQDEIKRAFRRKARETHPDANPGGADAEHRFREAALAYEVLSDPSRRAAYDRGAQFESGDFFSSFAGIDDLLSRFFGGGLGFTFGEGRGPAAGADVGVGLELTLAEAAADCSREVRYRARLGCPACGGEGAPPESPAVVCDRCAGRGSVRVTRQTFLGPAVSIVTCDKCRGRGRMITTPCPRCGGSGCVADEATVTVNLPAGIEDGSRLRVAGKGSVGEPGGRPGDLYVEVRVTPDQRFARHGADLVHRARLGLAEAALGTTIKVPTVDDGEVDIEVPPGTQPGTVFKLSRLGMPRLRRRGRGDLLVEVQVVVPQKLNAAQEEALRAYAAASDGPVGASTRPRRRRAR
ncbi:MAG TPA: DnaJ C-terminal domain-containing protein [Acidimicrobiia bacterium]|nr:DnaJ C-terminal domain-containing protein [Acidimicrobiia bacterium]